MQVKRHLKSIVPTGRYGTLCGIVLAFVLLFITVNVVYAQDGGPPDYRQFPVIGSRVAIWITAQVHLMFAAFMLGVPMFAVVVEYVGMRTGEKRFDDLAREFTKLIVIASSTTASFGALFTFLLFILYPNYMNRLADVFLPTMVIYPLLFFGEIFSLYLYWYSWDRLASPRGKKWHLLIGVILNLFGTVLMFVANAWLTFAISPESGGESLYDNLGNFTGTVWEAVNNATWWPINIHRIWSTDWFRNPVKELQRTIAAIEAANGKPTEPELSVGPIKSVTLSTESVIDRHQERPPARILQAHPYQVAKLQIPANKDLYEFPLGRMVGWVQQVVEMEGPVHADDVGRRIVDSAETRLGSRIKAAIDEVIAQAVRAKIIYRRGDFLWAKTMKYRVRSHAGTPNFDRRMDQIGPEEVMMAVRMVVGNALGMYRDDIPAAVCSFLGFGRTSEEMRRHIKGLVGRMIGAGKLKWRGDYLISDR